VDSYITFGEEYSIKKFIFSILKRAGKYVHVGNEWYCVDLAILLAEHVYLELVLKEVNKEDSTEPDVGGDQH
jgi:hypothetical protein